MAMLMNLQFIAEKGYDIAKNTEVRTYIIAKDCLSARGLERPRSTQAPCSCPPSAWVYQMYFP